MVGIGAVAERVRYRRYKYCRRACSLSQNVFAIAGISAVPKRIHCCRYKSVTVLLIITT